MTSAFLFDWQGSADVLERSFSLPLVDEDRHNSLSAALPTAQPLAKRRRRKQVASQQVLAPAAADVADTSDLQLLQSRGSSAASLAARRAARCEQGRVNAQGSISPASKSGSAARGAERLGPAETFLQALQDRLSASRRSAKYATASRRSI